MKISEIVQKILGLEKSVSDLSADKTKATDGVVSALAGEVAALKILATEKLEKKSTELDTATENLKEANTDKENAQKLVTSAEDAMETAFTALKLEAKEGATLAENILIMQGAVTATLAKLQVPIDKIPSAAPAAQQEAKPKSELTGLDRMASAMKIQGINTK